MKDELTRDRSLQPGSGDRTCPLCMGERAESFHQDRTRIYFRCPICELIFVPPHLHPSPEAEQAEYDLHQNSPRDAGYRRFLSRLFVPMQSRLDPASTGLDFGSGPGPTLSVMFEEVGHRMRIYDPFYAPDPSALAQQYDFITATEVVEHLHKPRQELDRLWACLRAGGSLGIMTKLALDETAFSRWHYKNDLTHVSFFSRSTMEWLADHWRAGLTFVAADAMLFDKPC